ncbi:MAG: IS200/IS605 family transposase [Acidimicrobiales bacterium]
MSDARFRRSAGGVTSLGLHVVWCPKYRKRVLGGRVATRLNELLDEIAADNDWQIVAREVMPDHVHIFVRVHPTDSPAEVARKFKGRTSRVLRGEFAWLGRRRVLWSKSYFAASVGYVSEQTVRRYIEHQWDAVA